MPDLGGFTIAPWTFVHVSDIQVGSPRSFRFAPAWNENWQTARQQIIGINPDLLLIGGDLTRDGYLHDFEMRAIRDDLSSLPFPYYTIPGNMDTGNKHARLQGPSSNRDDLALNVTSAQLQRFKSYFGTFPWSFIYKDVQFSGFYAAVAGSGLPEEEQMWRWLAGLKDLPQARHHVMIMHYALFIDRIDEPPFDITDPKQYLAWYFSIDSEYRRRIIEAFEASRVEIVISGHIHCRKSDVLKDIRFYKAPATCMSQWNDHWPDGDPTLGFLRFDVGDDGIQSTFVPLEQVSVSKGYGPGGHPRLEDRDYSIAWEK